MIESLDSSDFPPAEPPSPEVIELVQALLAPGPIEPVILARYRDPGAIEARARALAEQRAEDWPQLGKYRAQNAARREAGPPEIIFLGDSITEIWQFANPAFFSNGVLGRGISGQTSGQMLLRLYADVIALRPRILHLLAGGNDVAGNTGRTSAQDYKNNMMAMITLARSQGIEVVLGSITPAAGFPWRPEFRPSAIIQSLNLWLREYAASVDLVFVDYHSALADDCGGCRSDFCNDGVHPNLAGYAMMLPLVQNALQAVRAKIARTHRAETME